jgi:hypothetical protein
MKIAAAFILLLIILIPVMGLGITGDGTIKGKLQSFVTYSLALVSLLLSLLTVIAAAYSLADDIKDHRIYMVLTKPIRRYELLVGKILGIILLDLTLLVPLTTIIYGITKYIPIYNNATAQQMQTLDNEFFTARASIKPPEPDVRAEVLQTYESLKQEKQLPEGESYRNIIKYLTQLKKYEKRAVAPGSEMHWQFDNIRITDPNQNLFVRYKYDVSVNPPDLNIYSRWMAGDLRQLPVIPQGRGSIYVFDRKDLIRTFHELEVPANAVTSDGHLELAFLNPPINNTVVIFPPDEGLELLYKSESYTLNFTKAVIMIFLRLVFLACIGIFAASFLSFPVALLLCMAVLSIASISGFILESFNYLSGEVGTVYNFTIGLVIQMIPRFDVYNPSSYLVPARLISWPLLGKLVVMFACLQSFIVFLFSLLIFRFREIAKVII